MDIIGADTYKEGVPIPMYHRLREKFADRFLLCYHENGPIPEPDELQEKNLQWSWFVTWHYYHIREQNTKEKVKRIYQHP